MRTIFIERKIKSQGYIMANNNVVNNNNLNYPVIIKPTDRSGGRDFSKVKKNKLKKAVENASLESIEKK